MSDITNKGLAVKPHTVNNLADLSAIASTTIQPQTLANTANLPLMVTIDTITNDNVINISESNQNITLTGTVSGDYDNLVSVIVTINGNEYIANLESNSSYSVSVLGSDLAHDTSMLVQASAIDDCHCTYAGEGVKDYQVEITAPIAPEVLITEDTDNNGIIDNSELEGDIDYLVTVNPETKVGSLLQITTTYTVEGVDSTAVISVEVTEDILHNGYSGTFADVIEAEDGAEVIVKALIIDEFDNSSATSLDCAVLNLPDPCEDPGVDADPSFLWHLGANLTATEGPSDHRGKSGGKYGDEVNYLTSDQNDAIYIGYNGFDSQGNLRVSRWDGDFERDHGDGHGLWNLATYAGHDLVHIREDQNAYTSAKLGNGNDTYYVQGKLDSALWAAQTNPEARSYIYTEECHDTVVIGGNGEGKVTGWGIDGGRIFTGSGNDNVTVYGEVDDGGVIDLGAGRVEYALDEQAAASVDSFENTNYLSISHNLGNAGDIDFGHVFGGDANDNVEIGTFVEGSSIIDLGHGDNNISIGDDLDGQSAVITGNGEDTLYIGDDTEDQATVDLGDGNNSITIASYVEDSSIIRVGNGNDVIDVAKSMVNHSEIHLGEGCNTLTFGKNILGSTQITAGSGVDTLTVGHKIDGHANINLGAGNNVITTGDDIDGYSTLTTLAGRDSLTVGEDIEDYAIIDLGDGCNTVEVVRHVEDHSSLITGICNDTLNVGGSILNHATIDLGAGNDVATIQGTIKGSSHLDLGSGNDSITIHGGLISGTIEGGLGEDSLILDYTTDSGLVDACSHISNATTENITGIENVQLNGQNVIDIRFADLLQDDSREGALFIEGTSQSKVDLGSTNWNKDGPDKAKFDDCTGGDWSKSASEVVEGVNYDIYQNSQALDNHNDVYIEQGIQII